MLHLRPQNRFEEFGGMYLVGGMHPGSGLPVIFESARISSKLLLEDLVKPREPVFASALHETGLTAERFRCGRSLKISRNRCCRYLKILSTSRRTKSELMSAPPRGR